MVEKLKRITSEADHHKVLDLAYLAGFIVGLFQFTDAMKAMTTGQGSISLGLLAFQMILMSLCGGVGYYWHIRGMVFKEATVVAPIITGFLTLVAFSAMTQLAAPVKDPFLVNLGGLSVTIASWFIIEMSERLYKINARRKQIKVSQKARVKAGTPTSKKIIEEKANEIAGLLKKEG